MTGVAWVWLSARYESPSSVTQVAREVGLKPKLLYKWRAAYRAAVPVMPDEEMVRLRRELAEVRQERDILKKALAIFSRQL